MSQIPDNLRYTKEHEWARKTPKGTIVVGITAHAVDQLGDITMVSLPEVGTEVAEGESFGDVDSVTTVAELYAPLAGKVVGANDQLQDAPEKVNEDPYGDGWMLEISPSDPAAFESLLDAAAYARLIAE